MVTTIIGLGLIGGSLALDLRKRGFATRLIGVDANEQHQEQALTRILVDEIMPLKAAVEAADLVVLAIPVKASIKVLPQLLDYAPKNTVITDMGSTKRRIIEQIKQHPKRGQFVAAHPMAGTEFSGPQAAIHQLFDEKVAIICDRENTNTNALNLVQQLFEVLNMRVIFMDAQEHDKHAAYVSHISHISSFVLATTVLKQEKNDANIFNLASGGFQSTVRLAKSSPQMWAQIFEQNNENVLEVLNTYITQLMRWRNCITAGAFDELEGMMAKANSIRKVLDTPPIERLNSSSKANPKSINQ